jgi:hypothetical protein
VASTVTPRVAQDVRGELAGDDALHLGGLSGGERHGGVFFYLDRRATSTPPAPAVLSAA